MNSRRSRPSPQPRPRTPAAACLAVLLAVTALTGCQPRPDLTVGNQSSHDLHVKHLIVGIDPARVGDIVLKPGHGDDTLGLTTDDGKCELHGYLIAWTTDPNHAAHHGPPLCRGDTWTVTDQTLAQAAS